jgi:hypothetical protein
VLSGSVRSTTRAILGSARRKRGGRFSVLVPVGMASVGRRIGVRDERTPLISSDGGERRGFLALCAFLGVAVFGYVLMAMWCPSCTSVITTPPPPTCHRVCSGDASVRSAIVYNTTWRAGLRDRGEYIEMLGQLGQMLCADVFLMPPKLSLDPGHNDGDALGDGWRWDLYFSNVSLVESVDTDGTGKHKPVLSDWSANARALTELSRGVEVFGDAVAELSDDKILADLRTAVKLTKANTPFVWHMNFEIAWGERYGFWQRTFGDDTHKTMFAVDLQTFENELSELGLLSEKSTANLRGCNFARVTASTLVEKLADIAIATSLGIGDFEVQTTSRSGKSLETKSSGGKFYSNTSPELGEGVVVAETDEAAARSLVVENTDPRLRNEHFATLHTRRGDMLGWCDTDPDALARFLWCALLNSTDEKVHHGDAPLLWFTDDDDGGYRESVTAALTTATEAYRRMHGTGHTTLESPGVVFGDALVEEVIHKHLVELAHRVNVDLGQDKHGRDNYLIYQVGRVIQDRAGAMSDAAWQIHFAYHDDNDGEPQEEENITESFARGSCSAPPNGDKCAEDGPVLKMARGEDVGDEFENMLDIGNNAYLVGGDALVAKRAKRTKEAL